ncbi:uncharacterized protein A1O5_11727 [Cladophialophora psammophila CBS 110553]|uniref:Transcription factor domain-containing protein n=1 Tax=Cladophialophora psammophila CBS 110553 TaxID=1182543 RepID=W9W018_9EURO|nr:uncharacterized protein A1O5_11727 [Cladophialophora psammophila CBS 110553]EXJ61412.1 hypothetical protein A1O5_11727 [Cladophialophora psammophila CBS 110553]
MSLPGSTASVTRPSARNDPELTTAITPMNSETLWTTLQPPMEQETCLDDMIWTGLGPNNFLDFDTFMNSDSQDWMDLSERTPANEAVEGCNVTDAIAPAATSVLSPTEFTTKQSDENRQNFQFGDGALSGFWHGSPISLLNSTAVAEQMTKNLYQVYDTMMIGLASRYLSYTCNQFAGTHGYIIESESHENQIMDLNHEICRNLAGGIVSGRNPYEQTVERQGIAQCSGKLVESFRRITLIGVARFLDNFGALYGNRLDQEKRKLDEATFKSVLQAFALQFGSPDDLEFSRANVPTVETVNGVSDAAPKAKATQMFTAAWFNAHSNLMKSLNHGSFVHLYAVYLFHMTAQPEEARLKAEFSNSPVYFLDRALLQSRRLSNLLGEFYSHLDSKSVYRTLLDSSHRIFRWFGYVRDTMASLLCDRPCTMEDLPTSIAGLSITISCVCQAYKGHQIPSPGCVRLFCRLRWKTP